MNEIISTNEIANKKQREVAKHDVSAWVSASAGSGKTKVLVDRVINLLLSGADVRKIWCITYTKAGASEMIDRINKKLKSFAIISDEDLKKELEGLNGRALNDNELSKLKIQARLLFAKVIDDKTGIKVTTIHGLCQSILKRFPIEASISPYFKVMDENDANVIFEKILSKVLNEAYRGGENNQAFLRCISEIKEKTFKETLKSLLSQRIKILAIYNECGNDFDIFMKRLYQFLNIEYGKDFNFYLNKANLEQYFEKIRADINDGKVNATKQKVLDAMSCFFEQDGFNGFKESILTKDNTLRKAFENSEILSEVGDILMDLVDKQASISTLQKTGDILKIAIKIITEYQKQKERKLCLDYDDLILITKNLLNNKENRDWILYRLDDGLSHLLIDEAQDTSPEQWDIIKSLSEEFLSGDLSKNRTVFVVGDRKQSIYSFQGARPDNFDKMRRFFESKLKHLNRPFSYENMAVSFRSNQGVLDLVNMFLSNKEVSNGVLGDETDFTHLVSDNNKGFGSVIELWDAVYVEKDEEEAKEKLPLFDNKEKGDKNPSFEVALKIAKQIKAILDGKIDFGKKIKPSDIMILMQKRQQGFIKSLMNIFKSSEFNIPISGVDRFEIKDSIAIKDLIALGDFLVSPYDNLSLAVVLKSPLYNFDDEMLFNLCKGREKSDLYERLKNNHEDVYAELSTLLNMSLNLKPFEIYSFVLDGKMNARKRFISRMDKVVDDALKEFLNIIINYEQQNTPSLISFLKWIKSSEINVKRETDDKQVDAVRIMTAHGAKGLQSEVIFIANGFASPNFNMNIVTDDENFFVKNGDLPSKISKMVEKAKQKEQEEYKRLLYVAISRAKSMVYIAGFYNSKITNKDNWYSSIETVLTENKFEKTYNENIDSEVYRIYNENKINFKSTEAYKKVNKGKKTLIDIPNWVKNPPKSEPSPTKPLTPSKMEEEDSPYSPNDNYKFKRGLIIHKLLEILPKNKDIEMAKKFIDKEAKEFSKQEKEDVLNKTLNVINQFSDIFSENSRAEVPIIGLVEGVVVSGQIDRMVVKNDEIIIIDYKTNRLKNGAIDKNILNKYEKQMSLYKILLKNIYKDRKIKAYILWIERLVVDEY